MLYLVTGVPGASKTAFVVTELDKIETSNKINLAKNIEIFNHNKTLFEKYRQDFSYFEIELGSGHLINKKMEILSDDYFDMLGQEFDDLRPDDYFLRSTRYNEIIERINERDGEQQFKTMLPVRTIYSNIKALKVPYSRANVYDWRECPDGSIIVIDEVQLVEPYSDLKNKTNDIVQELTIHRHRGFDFYFITQAPSLLHPTIKELIGCHYHITRPYGRTPKVYQYGSCRAYPNTMINKINCEDKFNFKPQDRIFKLYKSTSINTHKGRIPKGVFIFASIAMLCILGFLYMVTTKDMGLVGDMANVATGKDVKSKETSTHQNISDGKNEQKTDNQQSQPQNVEQLKDEIRQQVINELHQQYLAQYTLEVGNDDLIRPASIISYNGKCRAYNVYGDGLNMSQKKCNHLLANRHLIPKKRNINHSDGASHMSVNHEQHQQSQSQNLDVKQGSSNVINAGNNADFFATEQNNLVGVTSVN